MCEKIKQTGSWQPHKSSTLNKWFQLVREVKNKSKSVWLLSQRKKATKSMAGKCLLKKAGEVLTIFYFGILVHAENNLSRKKIKTQILVMFLFWKLSSTPGLGLLYLLSNTICGDRWGPSRACGRARGTVTLSLHIAPMSHPTCIISVRGHDEEHTERGGIWGHTFFF